MNIFSLHGKWYEDNENRLTSNVLFFLDQFRNHLLEPFLKHFLPHLQLDKKLIKSCRIRFQVYDSGKIPDAEITIGNDTRILIESKVKSNIISFEQVEEYCVRLKNSIINYPNYYLFIITQTNQTPLIANYSYKIENKGIVTADKVCSSQWRVIIDLLKGCSQKSSDPVLKKLMHMFTEEVQNVMYNRIDIETLPIKDLYDVVLTTQNSSFFNMALEDWVFWPYSNFSPAQYVAYYFTKDCTLYGKTISHIARIKYIWHDVTIDEVLSSIPEFNALPNFDRFKQRAVDIYTPGSSEQFAIAITDEPIKLKNPILFDSRHKRKLHPNILPGRHTTLAKILTANTFDDLC